MKIVAIVEKSYRGLTPTGGAETMIADMLSYLVEVGWTAQCVVLNGSESEVLVDGVTVTRTQNKEHVWNICSTADVLMTHLGGTPRARGLARGLGVPLVQLIHNTNEYSVGFLGDGCDFAIYNSEWVSKFHKVHAKDPLIKVWQGNGTNSFKTRQCSEWPSIIVRPPVFNEYKDLANPDGYITLINLNENKGVDIFYELAERNPQWEFMGVIGGYSQDQQQIRDLSNVKIQEHVRDVTQIYSMSSIVVMPSLYESYGRVAVEAMTNGVPVVASDTPGLKEATGYSHLLRSRGDIPGWEQAISWVYNNYSDAQDYCLNRHTYLYDQSRADMTLFADELERLVNTWD